MKKTIILILAGLPSALLAQQVYTVNVNVKNVNPSAKAYLFYMNDNKEQKDSATLVNGQFTFKGNQDEPNKAFVVLSHKGTPIIALDNYVDKVGVYLENGIVTVNAKDSLAKATVGGTNLNSQQQEMIDLLAPFKKGTPELRHAKEKFISSHANSLVGLNLIRSSINPATELEEAKKLFSLINPKLQATIAGQSYQKLIDGAEAIVEGKPAPDFTAKNTNDQDVSLSSLKGQYVLVDFWASWCGPCRKLNPSLVASYKKFHDKKFTVLGVSLDGGGTNPKGQWINAIAKDGLLWEQVSDLKGWLSPIAHLYNVTAIPSNFLIDPSGKIIGKNLAGEDLDNKLKELLD